VARPSWVGWIVVLLCIFTADLSAQGPAGSIRGVVYDADFDAPLPLANVQVVETGQTVTTGDQGNYVVPDLAPGRYTLVFFKDGFVRQVRADVVVRGGQLTEVDVSLAGQFTEMEEFVVEDVLQLGGGTEASLLALRFESPALLDSISSEFMSRAGASDAASALTLVSGASVQEGKFAVIRGLPDRYVSSQLNGVRLPSADENTRAVELDQFPSPVIESIQVKKTFTPDQQGDASGGAVDVRLRGIPEQTVLQFKAQTSYNTQVTGRRDFLTYDGGGISTFGFDDGGRDPKFENIGSNWDGAVGTSEGAAPTDWKVSGAIGGKMQVDRGVRVGAFASLFYERDSSFYDDGQNNSLWQRERDAPLEPEKLNTQDSSDFKTAVFDVTQGSQSVQWGGLATLGLETENHLIGLNYLYTHSAEDTATLAVDTRSKEFFFPGHDPEDPETPGHGDNTSAAPYIRTETLEYTERDAGSLQLYGRHTLPFEGLRFGRSFEFGRPELDWTLADSFAQLDQPDKRQFGSFWRPDAGMLHSGLKPAANVNLGNLQRIFKEIEEDSLLYSVNLKLPFEQWDRHQGYLKLGLFDDSVDRTFDQNTFSNLGDNGRFLGPFDADWSEAFPNEDHPIDASPFDIDYEGEQDITAFYVMGDLPLSSKLNLIGGVRFESTEIGVVNIPATEDAIWFPPDATQPEALDEPGEADVSFSERNALPSIGLTYEPTEKITLRGSYSETIARQTFKELTPVIQQEFLGAPIFIGNPELGLASLKNYDLRLDYRPQEGSLISFSWFHKDVEDPIEFVQRITSLTFTTAVNYPQGELNGYEFEVRQALGSYWESLEGFSLGGNATVIHSEVDLTDEEIQRFEGTGVPMESRDMTNAPEHLYNFYVTYDHQPTSTQVALFYTIKGDTLVSGAGINDGNFVPSIYQKEFGTLNVSVGTAISRNVQIVFKGRNLTNPDIEEVYRSGYVPGGDSVRSSFSQGTEYSIGLSITN